MMARQESLLSSSSFSYGFKYDVFLSFRGVDTRHGFTGYLYKALGDRGIHTFFDDEELQRGEKITPSLLNAIEESRIAIIVLSTKYASSSFCLDELVHILHCIKEEGRLVLPVFYKVDPSDVRHQKGSYGEALVNHELKFRAKMERLQRWRTALHQVANLSGFHFKHGDEYEYKFIESIVKEVSKKIKHVPLPVADYPVGLESRVEEVKVLMDAGSNDGVHMIGIHGIGGVGKTTLALSVFNSVAQYFEGLCFLQNVRENSIKHGLEHLQETLLLKTVGEKDIKFAGVNEGMATIEHRLQRKKILLVLDDVDKLKQLQATCGKPDWFGSGSRIIITTRDKDLLTSHEVKRTYEVDLLNDKEALELVCCYAFKTEKIDPHYVHILNRAVSYASGLPLALEVIGSNLFVRRKEEWESTLDQYEIIPNDEIQNILKVSFDSLKENQKKIFLDIACFFNGNPLAYVKTILHAHHGFLPDDGVGVLMAKSLIKIDVDDDVTLHDLIEDMGKEIVRLEAPDEPGKRSRLWFHEDIHQVLEKNTGSGVIQIMILDFPEYEVVEWDGNSFKDMKNLKTLIIRSVHFSEGPKHLPNSLRVLEWRGYPSTSLPSDFNPKNLVILELPQSPLVSIDLPMSNKRFEKMKVLNFDDCECIREIPDMSGVPNLEKLSFRCCDNLIKMHESVGFLNKLKFLNAEGCEKFSSFPPLKLTSLEELGISHCLSLENFPEILGKIGKITKLDISDTPIKDLPSSIKNLTGLQTLELRLCGGVFQLPRSISMMPELKTLIVGECENFREIEGIPPNIQEFGVWKSTSLKDLDLTLFPECLTKLVLHNCENLQEIRGISRNIRTLRATECPSLTSECRSMLLNKELHKDCGNKVFLLPGLRIPEWFEHRFNGESISFRFRNMIPAMSLCFAFFFNGKYPTHYSLDIEVNGIPTVIGGSFTLDCKAGDYTVLYDITLETFLRHDVLFLEENIWNCVVCTLSYWGNTVFVKESGMHVFIKQGWSMEDIEFTDQQALADSHKRQMILKRAARSLRLRSWEEHGCEIVSRKRKIGVLNVDLDNEAWEPCCPAPSKVALNSAVSSFASGAAGEEGESSQNNLASLPLLEPQLGQGTEWLSLLPPPASNSYVNSQ